MVKLQQQLSPQEWMQLVLAKRQEPSANLIQQAVAVYNDAQAALLVKGIAIADILFSLGLDNETLAAAIIYPAFQSQLLHADLISEKFGLSCEKLLRDVQQLQIIDTFQQSQQNLKIQSEKIRKMLLSIVSDVRSVLLILAEHLWLLRTAKYIPLKEQQSLAEKTLHIFAPLANRLGIWQLKWEIEDLCLRYLKPDVYSEIAKGLAAKRTEREAFVTNMIREVKNKVQAAGIAEVDVQGRVKHIYSIYSKMQRKRVPLQQIYDACAIRVITETVDDCYRVLGILQSHWEQVGAEFDDYISKPKPNGYQSIHTVMIGPSEMLVEVQIRTREMHQASELGVAAHWRYKEGILETSGYETKIELLRQVMAWQKELIAPLDAKSYDWSQVFADRIYVFTPNGDVVDLPQGATPLDFAYHIHSEVGHRCRGAKIAGHIVPLTYTLKTGECIEILTAKHANPSRDWLNPHAGYLKTSRARAKAMHWFKLHDSDAKLLHGKDMLEKELKRIKFNDKYALQEIAQKLNYKTADDLLIGLANGDASLTQIIHHIAPPAQAPVIAKSEAKSSPLTQGIGTDDIQNLLTQIAKCCKPLPGDAILGYVSRSRGISIHRIDCRNLKHAMLQHPEKAVQVNWDKTQTLAHRVDLRVIAKESHNLLTDLTKILAANKIKVIGLQTKTAPQSEETILHLTIEIKDLSQMQQTIHALQAQPEIIQVERI